MKVQTDQIKRSKLIEPFFDKELLPDNSFCTYIEVSPYSQKQASDRLVSTPSKNISKKSFEDYKTLINDVKTIDDINVLKDDIENSSLSAADKVDLFLILTTKISKVDFSSTSKKSCEVDKKLLSNLEKLKKAKTKFDIAWCLDHFFGYCHMVLLSDGMKKADLVAKKEAVLKKYEDLEK